jgi:hypothetical protein
MTDVLHDIPHEAPRAVAFLAILVVGWLIARAVRAIVAKALVRVGFADLVERGGIKAALERSGCDATALVAGLAYYTVLLVAVQFAFGIWGPNPVSALITALVAWLPRAFAAIAIVVVAAGIARAVKDIVGGALGGLSYGRPLAGSVSAVIIGLGGIAALNQVGVATSVTTPVLIAVLATVGGVIVVGVGGGLVRPMQDRWALWLARAEDAAPVVLEQARAYDAGRREAAAHEAELREQMVLDATVPLGHLNDTSPSHLNDQTIVISRDAIPNQ